MSRAAWIRWLSNLTVMAASLLFTLLLAEGAIRLFRLVPVNDYRRLVEASATWRMKPHAFMVDDQPEFKVPIQVNGAGYRDREFAAERSPGKIRIAFIGDSFTFGTGVEARDRATDLLEKRLRAEGFDAEVYNYGLAGLDTYGADEVLRQGAWPFRPDWVVLVMYLGNDVSENARRARAASGPAVAGAARPGSAAARTVRWLAGRSQLYQFVMIRVASIPALRTLFNRLKAANLVGEVADQLVLLRATAAADTSLWAPTFRPLDDFLRFDREHRLRTAVILLPSRLQYDDAVWTQLVRSRGLREADYERALPSRVLARHLSDLGCDVVDPLADFRATGPRAGATYYPINGHMTVTGNEILADALDRYFRGALARARAAGATATP